MTRTEHLLTILAEECNEVAQRVSKTLRFGPKEIQPGQEYSNASRVLTELADLEAIVELLVDAKVLPSWPRSAVRNLIDAKKCKVEQYLGYSKVCGTLGTAHESRAAEPGTPEAKA
jgi:hypothetical protein